MQNYKTADEMSVEWGITPRHVQYLCRKEKIEGAVKRAGAWFIPSDAPIPNKNTKSDAKGFAFVGTKNKVFETAIELFMLRGFSEVSLRDIASSVGIRQSTIYNHFKSKQDMLDTIYEYYCYYYLVDRPSLQDLEPALREGSIADIVNLLRYEFRDEYRQKLGDITKIIFQRIAIDDRARHISKELMLEEGIRYVEEAFNKGIAMGRFAPFDTHTVAVYINSVRLFTLYHWIIDPTPDNMIKVIEDEHKMYQHVASLVPDLLPAAAAGFGRLPQSNSAGMAL